MSDIYSTYIIDLFSVTINYIKNIFNHLFNYTLSKDLIVSYEPSKSKDVATYFLYYELFPINVSYNSNVIDLGQVTEVVLSLYLDANKKYNIGISAVDSIGNESDIQLLTITTDK